MLQIEKERKFILRKEYFNKTEFEKGAYLEQGYLVIEDKSHVRIRIVVDKSPEAKAYLTYKQIISTTDRHEFEIEIPVDEARNLLNLTKRKFVKTRYSTTFKDNKIDVDIYGEDGYGLSVVEIEYTSNNLSNDSIPLYCGNEITGIDKYSNVQIALDAEKYIF